MPQYYIQPPPMPVAGVYSVGVYRKRKTDGVLVASFRHETLCQATAWAQAFIGSLAPTEDELTSADPPPAPAPPATPAAESLATANDILLALVPHNGERITKADVEAYLLEHSKAPAADAEPTASDA